MMYMPSYEIMIKLMGIAYIIQQYEDEKNTIAKEVKKKNE